MCEITHGRFYLNLDIVVNKRVYKEQNDPWTTFYYVTQKAVDDL